MRLVTLEDLVQVMSNYRRATVKGRDDLREAAHSQQRHLSMKRKQAEFLKRDTTAIEACQKAISQFLYFASLEDNLQTSYMISLMEDNGNYDTHGRTY